MCRAAYDKNMSSRPMSARAHVRSGPDKGPWGSLISSLSASGSIGLMMALALGSLGALCTACYYINGVAAFSRSGVSGALFSFGGAYGHKRPISEVTLNTVCASLLGLSALGFCDFVYARHTKARWFGIHVIANVWIALLCLPDVVYMVSDPLGALGEKRLNHWPASFIFSVHVYHMAFFDNLAPIDWLHHLLMVVVGGPLLITAEVGPLMDYNHFFMCGVPGGIDYLMLFLVKHGWMKPMDEKRLNSAINVWFRAPWLISVAVFAYIQLFVQHAPLYIRCFRCFLLALASWNGLFFMERVVGNYHVNAFKVRKEREARESRNQPTVPSETLRGESMDYETEEHMLPSIPTGVASGLGLGGMRVSVSKQDLVAIASEAPKEAYPTEHAGKKGR